MNYEEFKSYLSSQKIQLNKQQETAMRVVKGPALLLAVPGSGKTTTLIARIGYMIHCNRISPDKILVLTYTNAATNDMRERYISIFGSDAPIRFQTINSFCNGVLRDFELNHQIRIPRLMEDTNQLVTKLYQEVYQILSIL